MKVFFHLLEKTTVDGRSLHPVLLLPNLHQRILSRMSSDLGFLLDLSLEKKDLSMEGVVLFMVFSFRASPLSTLIDRLWALSGGMFRSRGILDKPFPFNTRLVHGQTPLP